MIESLTPRQAAVLALVHAGMVDKEIADQLHCTRSTIRAHLALIFQKLQVRSRVSAALVWERHYPKGLDTLSKETGSPESR